MLKKSNKYFYFVVATMSITSILILLSIFFIINTTFAEENDSDYINALRWQFKSKGVISMSAAVSTKFKEMSTNYFIIKNDVDTLVLGSSTSAAIRAYMFDGHIAYNGAKNSNPLFKTISEANYYIKYSNNIKYIFIAFDWALGFPYAKYTNHKYVPSSNSEDGIDLFVKIKDAVSYQRIKIVVSNIYNNIFNPATIYECPKEDNIGTDFFFTPQVPRVCSGIRYDGSGTFSIQNPLSKKKWKDLLNTGLEDYKKPLRDSLGKVDSKYLDDLKKIDENLKGRGGKLIIVVPPLMPGATALIKKSEDGGYLEKTMNTLLTFTAKSNIEIIDASQSEKYGCIFSDFMDVHHAFPECYEKIMQNISY